MAGMLFEVVLGFEVEPISTLVTPGAFSCYPFPSHISASGSSKSQLIHTNAE